MWWVGVHHSSLSGFHPKEGQTTRTVATGAECPTPLPKKGSSLGKKGRFKKKSHFWLVLTYETADEGCGKGGPSGVCEIWTIFALELVSYMHACNTS